MTLQKSVGQPVTSRRPNKHRQQNKIEPWSDSSACTTEQALQQAVIQHLKWRAVPGLVFIHVPNGGFRRPIEAAIFRSGSQ
jgi:hypothetical protein